MKCHYHEKKEAVAACVSCGSLVCEDCAVEIDNKNYCKQCIANSNIFNHKNSNTISGNLTKTLNITQKNKTLCILTIAFCILGTITVISSIFQSININNTYGYSNSPTTYFPFIIRSMVPMILLSISAIMILSFRSSKKMTIMLSILSLVIYFSFGLSNILGALKIHDSFYFIATLKGSFLSSTAICVYLSSILNFINGNSLNN